MSGKNIIIAMAAVLACAALQSCGNRLQDVPAEEYESVADTLAVNELGICDSDYDVEYETVGRGDFFAQIMNSYGVSNAEVLKITEAMKGVFDVRDIRVGNDYSVYISKKDSLMDYWVYGIDRKRHLVLKLRDSVTANIVEKQTVAVPKFTDVTINNSLWYDMVQSGASPLLIMKLSDIYAWTVDFFALQKGDSFKIIYDEILCDGELFDIGDVRYVEFVHDGEKYPSVMFDQGDGGNVFWNDKGESMRKAFLKAPLNYSRVSSGFSYARRHPVTRKVQPHTGVDYAAPAGTPVMTIGDGVVVERQYKGANGNIVKIRHNSVYTSAYLHLSRFAKGLKVGQRVRQGQVIGYVGSTGRSTGPHLDFRIWKNGTPINPLKMESPSAEPLKKENMDAFMSVLKQYESSIDSLYADELYVKAMSRLSLSLSDDVEAVSEGEDK